MKHFPGFSSLRLPLAVIFGLSMAACTSGGGGGNGDSSSSSSSSSSAASCGSTVTLTGIVIDGIPVPSASVVVKDAQANTRSATAASDGTYSVNVGCLSAPLAVEASGIVAGRQVVLHSFLTSVSGSRPTLNVTPLTDGVFALVGGVDPVSYFSAQDFAALAAVTTSGLNAALVSVLGQVDAAAGLPSSPAPNFFTDPINPSGRSGLDEVMQLIKVVTLPASNSGGQLTGEQVQVSSRFDPAQQVVLTFANGTITASSSTASSGAVITMASSDTQSFNNNGANGFGGIDSLIATLNGEIAVSGGKLSQGEFNTAYKNDGRSTTVQGGSPNYTGAVIERCNVSALTCLVRLGYSWANSTGGQSGNDYYFDTLRLESTGLWDFYGNQQPFPVKVGYRFVLPSFPSSLVTPDPTGFVAPTQPAAIEQLAVTVDTTPILSGNAGATVQGVNIYTVNAASAQQALVTTTSPMLTPSANRLRSATTNPLTLVLPLTQAQQAQLNAANGHVLVQVVLSNTSSQCSGTNPATCVDRYLTLALDPGTTSTSNQALLALPYPSLLNDSLPLFLGWDTTSDLPLSTSFLAGPVASASPGLQPVGDVTAVFGYNSDLTQTKPPYAITGELEPVSGSVVSNKVLLSKSSLPSTVDRKLLLGTEDANQNHYVTAYCVGTNVVANCQ